MRINFFELIRSARAELQLTSEQVADEIGIGHSAIRNYENGTMPRLDAAQKIAEYYGFELKNLKFDKPEKKPLRVSNKVGLGLKIKSKPELEQFAKAIRGRRLSLQIQQIDLAKRLGVARISIQRWEAGVFYPKEPFMTSLLNILKLDRSVMPKGKPLPKVEKPSTMDRPLDLVRGYEEYSVLI